MQSRTRTETRGKKLSTNSASFSDMGNKLSVVSVIMKSFGKTLLGGLSACKLVILTQHDTDDTSLMCLTAVKCLSVCVM